MKNRSLAVTLTVLTALICLCLALLACLAGGVSIYLKGQPGIFDPLGGTPYRIEGFSPAVGYGMVCVSFLFVLVPVVVGIFALRRPKEEIAPLPPSEPLPPPS